MGTQQNWEEIYKNWCELPLGKIRLGDEGIWVRRLGGGLVGLDNDPLDGNYRWQDILDGRHNVVHRRWVTWVPFSYTPEEEEEKDLEIRKRVHEELNKLGNCDFFWKGSGFVLSEKSEEEVIDAINAFELTTVPMEEEE